MGRVALTIFGPDEAITLSPFVRLLMSDDTGNQAAKYAALERVVVLV